MRYYKLINEETLKTISKFIITVGISGSDGYIIMK